ncbi:MAG: twin-arginine translocation signal domain-containing protein, partial [Gemmataceae bacterium]
MNLRLEQARAQTRRQFLKHTGIGAIAFSAMLQRDSLAASADNPLTPRSPQFPAKAKSIIYLHMSGAPPQHELFDYKPKLVELNMKPCPDDLLKNQRFAFINGHPKLLGTPYK